MKHANKFILSLLVLISTLRLSAQTNDAEVHLTLLKGTIFTDTIHSLFPPSPSPSLNCNVYGVSNVGNKLYRFHLAPNNPNYVGKASATIQYTELKPPFTPLPKYTTYLVDYVESIVNASSDYVTVSGDQTVTIFPLTNDITTGADLQLTGIGQVQYGSAVFAGDSIVYTPSAELKNDYIVYSVMDASGTRASALIYIVTEDNDAPAVDTLRYTITNTSSQLIVLPFEGFGQNALNNPEKGSVSQVHPQIFKYIPNKGTSGEDNFLLSDANDNERLVIIKILIKTQNNSSVRDDRFYTPKNTAITFDVFANDLSSNFSISTFSSALSHDTLGVFSYTPPTGFSGEKNFSYTVNYGGYTATGKIRMTIGNYQPQQDIAYSFDTDKNTSLVLEYKVPVSGYSFEHLNDPLFGTLEIFNDSTSLDIDCNSIQSKAVLLYTPENNYSGNDEFDVSYCIDNNPCVVYKVYVTITDSDQDSLCKCVGRDCVWYGDMNGDGRVSISDLLPLGRFLGLKGDPRSDLDYNYNAGQHGTDWGVNQPNGINTKHVDGNGDGILSTGDTTSIISNYGAVHNFVPKEVLAIKDYPFELIPNSTELDSGDLLLIDIVIGSNANPVKDIFGLAFELNFPPTMLDSASLYGHFDEDGWFGNSSPTLQMVRQPKKGTVHAGFTRTGNIVVDEVEGFRPLGVSGNGKIGQLTSIVVDEVEGFKSDDTYIIRRINTGNIEMEGADGEKYLLPDTYVDVRINLDNKTPVPSEDKLLVFPNPAKDFISLHFNGRNIIKGYKMTDIFGNIVSQQTVLEEQTVSIITKQYPTGIYFLQVVTTLGVISKKIEIVGE
ncbi:MAG: T9SS type A sorting domain-containing protein [Saprospiraceae bacterium]|nr:T9SS type A sorting domain-containing protein [Saprospiraceae bacterium]